MEHEKTGNSNISEVYLNWKLNKMYVNEVRETTYIQFFCKTLILVEKAEFVCMGTRFMTLPTDDQCEPC